MPRVQNKRGTAAALAAVDPVPAAGELIYESDTFKIKVGDGTTAYSGLPYVTGGGGGGGIGVTDGDKGDVVVSGSGSSWNIDTAVLSAFGRTLIDDANATAALTTLGAVSSSDARLTDSREWTADTVTQAEAETGTATTRRAWTATRVFQAIAAWWAASAAKTKLDGIAPGATANSTDSQLRDRTTHTGVQSISTVDGLQTALDGKAASSHVHSASDVTSGSFDIARIPTGASASTVCVGNDSRLSDARTPTSHAHGNITNAGAIGTTSGLPIITTTSGVLTTGSFGTTAGTFAQGNDSRLVSDGNKGDITVGSSNTSWTINAGAVVTADLANSAVTYAKMQNVSATDRLLGRSTAGAGVVEEITCTSFGRSLIAGADAAAGRTTLGAAASSHTHASTEISDSTAAGRAILTAADAAAQRTSMGAAASSHTHASTDISDSSSVGRSLLTAASASAQRTAIGLPYATQSEVSGTRTTGSITSGQTSLTVASGTGINNGDFVVGQGITPGTTVSSGGGTTSITLSAAAGTTLSSAPVAFYRSDRTLSPGLIAGALCRAWCYFDGTVAAASMINASYNVSSITKGGTGIYTLNFSTAMPTADFCVVATNNNFMNLSNTTRTTSSASVIGRNLSNTPTDAALNCVAIFC